MSFTAVVLYLLSVAMSSSAESCPYQWCNCMNDTDASKAAYLHNYDFYEYLLKQERETMRPTLSPDVERMNAETGGNTFYAADVDTMFNRLATYCHVPIIKEAECEPIWRANPKVETDELCKWMSSDGKLCATRMEWSFSLLQNCDYTRVWESVIKHNWQESVGKIECHK